MKKNLIHLFILLYCYSSRPIALDYDTFVIPHPNAVKNTFRNFSYLETDRLILRKICHEDANAILALASDAQVTKLTAALELIQTIDDVHTLIDIMISRYESDLPARWAVVLKENNTVIGICGFVGYSSSFARAEIGYAFSSAYWGKGIATEAAQACIDYGFSCMNLNRIEGTCDIDNIGSARVLEKLGMHYEGTLKQHIWSKGAFRDRKMYALLKDDWLFNRH